MYTGFTESRPPKKATRSYSGEAGGRSDKFIACILWFIVLFAFPFQAAVGQKKTDIGIIGGTAYYLGDVNHSRHFYSLSPAGGLICRYNFNERNSVRFHGIYAMIKGDPAATGDPFPGAPYEAFTTNLVDLGVNTEFNFMPYEATQIRRDRYTPYVGGGLSYAIVFGGESTAALSFGAGFKYNVTRRMSGGLEWSFRKSFSDWLDGVQNTGYENNLFFHNKDWYSIVGVFITYKIFDWGLDCPAYE
jgi:opacity protein-like surface antigen